MYQTEVRPIVSLNCFCKLCNKQIPKGETAFVFPVRIGGKYGQVHLHTSCVDAMKNLLDIHRGINIEQS